MLPVVLLQLLVRYGAAAAFGFICVAADAAVWVAFEASPVPLAVGFAPEGEICPPSPRERLLCAPALSSGLVVPRLGLLILFVASAAAAALAPSCNGASASVCTEVNAFDAADLYRLRLRPP